MTDERRPHQTTRTSSSGSNALRVVEKRDPKLLPAEKELISQVAFAWAEHQGWPRGMWPRDRRYDAILIAQFVRQLGGPIEFWRAVIAQTPRGCQFTILTTKGPSGATWLENFFIREREGRWAEQKKRYADEAKSIGDILRRLSGAVPERSSV